MCQRQTLSTNPEGFVLWCTECQTYQVHFNNTVLNLDKPGFNQFKNNLSNCYADNLAKKIEKNKRHIFLDTRLVGLQLCFSTQEVGSLLYLFQEAALFHLAQENN